MSIAFAPLVVIVAASRARRNLDLAAPQPSSMAIDVPPCYGVQCQIHGSCLNYARVDGSTPGEPVMADCGPEHSAYIAAVPA
jgi:hypothetical protein